MYWITAIEMARKAADLSYEEWCNLYVDHKSPTDEQLRVCEATAYEVLLRNNVIEAKARFIKRPIPGSPIGES